MSGKPYFPLYTPCGHSIKELKRKAANLQKKLDIPRTEALNSVAREVKYSSWQELITQKPNPGRDSFYRDVYFDTSWEVNQGLYQKYINKHLLPDNKDSYRRFAVFMADFQQQIGADNIPGALPLMSPSVLFQSLIDQIKTFGVQGLAPKRLGNDLLESLVVVGKLLWKSPAEMEHIVLVDYYKALIAIVISISGQPLESDELLERIQNYLHVVLLELISRKTRLQIITPEADHLFDADVTVNVCVPPDVEEYILRGT